MAKIGEMKDCPICHSHAVLGGFTDGKYTKHVECSNIYCDFKGPEYNTIEEAIKTWNNIVELILTGTTSKDLELKLIGVMHSVDKWLEEDELNDDEVNRAGTMREKVLKIIENLEDENKNLKSEINKLKHRLWAAELWEQ